LKPPAIEPFRIHFPDDLIDDLRTRLDRARWPDEPPDGDWRQGTRLRFMRELVEHWRTRYDWRRHEAELNAFPQYVVEAPEGPQHFLHVPGRGPDPMPLLLTHGWPGSIAEFVEILPRLTDPARFGGDPADAFTVVAPSLPGFGFSFRPGQPRLSVERIAERFAWLMSDVLGYRRFGAQGGDWGAFVTSRLAHVVPQRLTGIHLNLLPLPRDAAAIATKDPREAAYRSELELFLREETGYQWIQGTRPQTLAYGLTDSPVGLAAWIGEKFHGWSDHDGDVFAVIPIDRVLTNIMIYWGTGAIGSSFWPYYARLHGPWPIPERGCLGVPAGYAAFPKEILRPPRSLAERIYDIRRWTTMPRGGHFAALEQPDLLATDVRAFFRPLRT
jgi:microsomal epoxide hydrolase